MYKVCLFLILALTVSSLSVKSHLKVDEEIHLKRRDLRNYFKGIGIDAVCAEIDSIFTKYAALSDDEDKDQLCKAEFGQFLRETFGDGVTDKRIGKLFNRFDTDENDDICQAEFAAAIGVECEE